MHIAGQTVKRRAVFDDDKLITVLHIEDNRSDVLRVRSELEVLAADITLISANRLADGLDYLRRQSFDVVLLDLELPDSTGLATFERLHGQFPEIPLIVLSGNNDNDIGLYVVRNGAQDFLQKKDAVGPLLVRSIRFAVERHHIAVELERNTRKLAASEARIRNIIEANADAMIIVDEHGVVRFINTAAERMFGHSADELIARQFGFPITGDQSTLIDIIRSDGTTGIAEMRVVEMQWGDQPAFLATLRDITELKDQEEALQQSEEKYRQIVETASEGICLLDSVGKISFVNRRFAEILGCVVEDMVGHGITHFLDSKDADAMSKLLDRSRQGATEAVEAQMQHVAGSEIYTIISVAPLYNNEGKFAGSLAMITDISERKQAEEFIRKANDELERRVADRTAKLAAANEELESFSYSVSHDLRAPLRAISGFSMIIQEDFAEKLDPEIQQLLHKICTSSQWMDNLIQGLLSFSRLGRQAMRFGTVDSRQLVSQVLEDLHPLRDSRRVAIVLGTLPECTADSTLLRQVFVNLIGNALKFTRNRKDTRIEIGTRTENGDLVWYVQDNGAGFDMKYSAKLFGVFQRLHSVQDYEGTGAGLAIVQRIISRHGGRIWATSQVDQGALFCFTLGKQNIHDAGDTPVPTPADTGI